MIPEIGHFALILALCLALLQGFVPLAGTLARVPEWCAVAVPAARAQFLFTAIAFACLTIAFVQKDFSVAYVAQNSNLKLPLHFAISAVWGAHEGSLLLWALILSAWTLAVTLFSRSLEFVFRARVIAVMGLISVGFFLFMLMTSNPFERLLPAPLNGRDLNPLLQDFGLIVHPPMLYMGYVGLAVPFSFAVAALLGGRLDAAWMRWTRPWTVIAWVFLTLGITLGSWWAYYELGWGGWWFWDPVENASFMPWLVATALLHSLAVSEQRGAFKAWTVLLAIFGFSLSLLGTFLVRSGVLVSVHAFATDPARGVFILFFLGLVIGSALTLYAWRAGRISGGGQFDLYSRETLLLINNVVLVVACASVLLGTLYPLVLDSLGQGKISVGPPYFNSVFVPLMLPLILIIGLGPVVRWKRDELRPMLPRILKIAGISVVLGVASWLAIGGKASSVMAAGAMVFALWVLLSTLLGVWSRVRNRRSKTEGIRRLPRAFVGMTLAHLGVGVFIIGVTATTVLSTESDVRLAPGETQSLGGYNFTFDGVAEFPGPNYNAERGIVKVEHDGTTIELHPEKRYYPIQAQPMTEAAIDASLSRDIYVALGEPLGDGAWSLRLYHKPLIRWIWLGGLMMVLGGLFAASDRRYRLAKTAPRPSVNTRGAEPLKPTQQPANP